MSKRVYAIKFRPAADVAPGDRVQVEYNKQRYTGTVIAPYNERFGIWRVQPDGGGPLQIVHNTLMTRLARPQGKVA